MIKFFRKIRQNLLIENKTGAYFKYAIGEIILVVIGILIALQINHWNENRKENSSLQILTENLNNEFEKNLIELELDISRIEKKISSIKTLLSYTGINNIKIEEVKMDSLLFEAIENPTWNPSSYVLNDIKISGKLSTLKNEDLKLLLFDWDRLYEDILEWHISLNTTSASINEVITKNGSFVNIDNYNNSRNKASKFDIKNLGLLQEIRFENVLENNLFATIGLEKRYRKATILIAKIIDSSKNDNFNK